MTITKVENICSITTLYVCLWSAEVLHLPEYSNYSGPLVTGFNPATL